MHLKDLMSILLIILYTMKDIGTGLMIMERNLTDSSCQGKKSASFSDMLPFFYQKFSRIRVADNRSFGMAHSAHFFICHSSF